MILILDFSFSQGGLTMRTPVYRFLPFIDISFLSHGAEDFDLLRLVSGRQGEIGMVPVSPTAQPFELFFLDFNEFQRKIAAASSEVQGRHLVSVNAQCLDSLQLCGQPMGIPAGNKRRIKTAHGLIFHHNILEDFI